MLKFMRDGNKITKYFSNWFKVRPGIDRFFMTLAFFFIFCHFICCVWYMQAKFNDSDPTNWIARNDLIGEDNIVVRGIYINVFNDFKVLFDFVLLYHCYRVNCWIWRYPCRKYSRKVISTLY